MATSLEHPGDEDGNAALMNYLHDHYAADPQAGSLDAVLQLGAATGHSHTQDAYTSSIHSHSQHPHPHTHPHPHPHPHPHTHTHQPPSPPDTFVPIPASLALLAETAAPPIAALTPPTSASGAAGGIGTGDAGAGTALQPELSAYGEMGGKRKKLPHERAGWAEMGDEYRDNSRRRKRHLQHHEHEHEQGHEQEQEQEHKHELEHEVDPRAPQTARNGTGTGTAEGDGGFGLAEGEVHVGGADVDALVRAVAVEHRDDLDPADLSSGSAKVSRGSMSKQARSEQNRRAQQAFRRRREEHIKKLEADSAAFEATKARLEEAHARLRDVALAYEASKIESAALKSALVAVVQDTGVSVLSTEGELVIDPGVATRDERAQLDDVHRAFSMLELQSRELAKARRR